ncbi:LOW QUALITY PROTEIN: uncharacterized protein LOC106168022 [Lingula anatina]|uniref:LOW QUALITY PROTEIN: uncharacterized protein LOC106168022 n=1 Tax=Lingula anatina TaxID=7574 RepID=A0A1S3IWQ6_LINAN|nr:LOW QUALITY PROTEIN: uncharacterized protein LOC106168022 [Lingula anatina]|eukprot:XP_013402401.2 LOW QUALITY PROTEIN: uncharacterized protein LOC106168022 [Lingula anatina]
MTTSTPDACSSSPCVNGTCISSGISYMCACLPGYVGTNCDVEINECSGSRKCNHGGTCVDQIAGFSCLCPNGTIGSTCNINDYCNIISPCQNNGQCVDISVPCTDNSGTFCNATYECQCQSGFTGINCEINIDECASSPCQNGATCIDQVNGYICSCPSGFTGTTCQVNINDCQSTSCNQRGTCVDGVNSFTCNCATGYTGATCNRLVETRLVSYSFEDSCFKPGDDKGITVNMDVTFPYFQHKVSSVFISDNGYLTFNTRLPFLFRPYPFSQLRVPLLGVFWLDQDFTNPGLTNAESRLCYQAYDVIKGLSDTGNYVKDVAEYEVNNNPNMQLSFKFKASFIFVVTWEKAVPYPSVLYYGRENFTYQAVIATDEKYTFAILNYGDMFTRSGSRSRPVYVGYATGDLSCPSFNHAQCYGQNYLSNLPAVYNINSLKGNTGSTGKEMYRLDNSDNQINYDQLCLDWALAQNTGLLRLLDQSNGPCPCTALQALQDFSYRFDTSTFCAISRFPAELGGGRQCCYNSQLWLITSGPTAGTMIKSLYPGSLREREDTLPKEWCCQKSNNPDVYCLVYQGYRPVDTCLGYGIRFPFADGDPHLATIDGKDYTFNGHGEYVMVETVEGASSDGYIPFSFQGRTQPALRDGQATNATVFSAFAAKSNNSDTLHVEMVTNNTALEVWAYRESTGQWELVNLTSAIPTFDNMEVIYNATGSSVTGVFSSGWSITISLSEGVLSFLAGAPGTAINRTRGLLGVFNNDITDDFTTPDGTILPINSTERQIHYNFGQLWMVQEGASLFHYKGELTTSSFQEPSFQPVFFDEISWPNETIKAEYYTICNNVTQCVYDYWLTLDKKLAEATATKQAENAVKAGEAKNAVPRIRLIPATVNVTGGDLVTVSVSVIDDDVTDVVSLSYTGNTTGTSFNNSTGLFTWTPALTAQVFMIRFIADDGNGGVSEASVRISYCSGCSSSGTCNFDRQTLPDVNFPNFAVATCECALGYTGDDCSIDLDGCLANPCPQDVNCTDVPAPLHSSSGVAFTCSDCPSGFTLDNNTRKCVDIDECAMGSNVTNNCEQLCENTEGSYTCTCYDGYRSNGSRCYDVDECTERSDNCDQICVNTNGSFYCECAAGYTLNVTSNLCISDSDICQLLNCSHYCTNSTGSVLCQCPDGFNLDTNNRTCLDINECSDPVLNGCDQLLGNCSNTAGGYTCSCQIGYGLASDKRSCEKCVAPQYGLGCVEICDCQGRAATCDYILGCVDCQPGWNGSQCAADINECLNNTICGNTGQCVNTNGSFYCVCPQGYVLNALGTCENIDECVLQTPCSLQATCNDTIGSYVCTCNDGYTGNGTFCADVDECNSTNPCTGPYEECMNTVGSYLCKCQSGFQRDVDGVCADDDECLHSSSCDTMATCLNTVGSFTCTCNAGYTGTGLVCNDIDECKNISACSGQGQVCNNTEGGFQCQCDSGYVQNNTVCEDINECDLNLCPISSYCTNIPGGYYCTCFPGLQGDFCNITIATTAAPFTATTSEADLLTTSADNYTVTTTANIVTETTTEETVTTSEANLLTTLADNITVTTTANIDTETTTEETVTTSEANLLTTLADNITVTTTANIDTETTTEETVTTSEANLLTTLADNITVTTTANIDTETTTEETVTTSEANLLTTLADNITVTTTANIDTETTTEETVTTSEANLLTTLADNITVTTTANIDTETTTEETVTTSEANLLTTLADNITVTTTANIDTETTTEETVTTSEANLLTTLADNITVTTTANIDTETTTEETVTTSEANLLTTLADNITVTATANIDTETTTEETVTTSEARITTEKHLFHCCESCDRSNKHFCSRDNHSNDSNSVPGVTIQETTTTTRQAPAEGTTVLLSITVNITYQAGFNDSTSLFWRALELQLASLYSGLSGFLRVVIIEIRNGSTIVDHQVVFNSTVNSQTKEEVASQFNTGIESQNKIFTYNGTEYPVTAASVFTAGGEVVIFPKFSPCDIYIKEKACQNGAVCETSNNTATCRCPRGYSGDFCDVKSGLTELEIVYVVLGSVGGVLLIVILILPILICCRHYRSKSLGSSSYSDITQMSYGRVTGAFHPKYGMDWKNMRDGRGIYNQQGFNWRDWLGDDGEQSQSSSDMTVHRDQMHYGPGFFHSSTQAIAHPSNSSLDIYDRRLKADDDSDSDWADLVSTTLDKDKTFRIKRPQVDPAKTSPYRLKLKPESNI